MQQVYGILAKICCFFFLWGNVKICEKCKNVQTCEIMLYMLEMPYQLTFSHISTCISNTFSTLSHIWHFSQGNKFFFNIPTKNSAKNHIQTETTLAAVASTEGWWTRVARSWRRFFKISLLMIEWQWTRNPWNRDSQSKLCTRAHKTMQSFLIILIRNAIFCIIHTAKTNAGQFKSLTLSQKKKKISQTPKAQASPHTKRHARAPNPGMPRRKHLSRAAKYLHAQSSETARCASKASRERGEKRERKIFCVCAARAERAARNKPREQHIERPQGACWFCCCCASVACVRVYFGSSPLFASGKYNGRAIKIRG